MPLFAGIPRNRLVRRVLLAGTTAAATAAALVAAPTAAASPESAAGNGPDDIDRKSVQRTAQDLGVSRAEAKQRLRTQDVKVAVAKSLREQLDSVFGGAYIDSRTGRLVVGVTTKQAAQRVTATKARVRVVDHSLRQLKEIQKSLQRVAVTGSTLAVDAKANAVQVTIPKSASTSRTRTLVQRAKSYGDAVDVSRVARGPRVAVLYGGEAIRTGGTRCSAAFNATSGGQEYVITAGHCTNIGNTWTVDEGTLGSTAGSNFPGSDYGYISNSGGIDLAPAVQRNGQPYDINSFTEPVSGMQVCKTGSTTGTTCGSITAYPVTVNYPSGTVSGLIQGNVCVQPGDSGGALYTSSGNQAVGIVSGGSTGGCGGNFTGFYENISDPLGAYSLSLLGGDGGDEPPDEPPDTGTWETYTSYQVGDQVTYNGQAYECLQAHTSLPGWEPPNTPALWQPV